MSAGLILGVLTLEVGLQIAAWWSVPGSRDAAARRLGTVTRLVSLLWHAMREPSAGTQAVPAPPFLAVPLDAGSPGWSYALQRNLEAMAAQVRRARAEPILLTYPSDTKAYGAANQVIRTTAASAGIRLIDLTPAFRERCAGWTCRELLPDQHPSREGHALVAHLIADGLASPLPASPGR